MVARRAPFSQIDVTRAMRGTVAAGLDPREFRYVLRDGEIRIEPIIAHEAQAGSGNSVDAILHGKAKK